ncbi:MAG: hypothetical protein U5R31_06415 [Acidimicrobiia bacterium]|nr:hypothetical protein [Acidimicrobiia bacterium]
MSAEDRLRRALEERASTVEPSVDAWATISSRRGPGSGLRSWILAAVAALTALALAGGVLALTRGDDAQQVTVGTAPGGLESGSEIVAVTTDGRCRPLRSTRRPTLARSSTRTARRPSTSPSIARLVRSMS